MFSRLDKENTENTIVITNATGINVITERCFDIRKKYTARKIKDLANTTVLNTVIIEKECFISLKKLIFDGPKYLKPLIDGMDFLSLLILVSEPEKLLQVEAS